MKVLVTGATGLIGREIVSELSKLNCEIIEVGSHRSKNLYQTDNKFAGINISDFEEVKTLRKFVNVDVLIHSAGLAHQFKDTKKEDFFSVNTKGTENICKIAVEIGVRHLILISSVSVYGNGKVGEKGIDENFECKPNGAYAESKLESENIARKLCEENNISLTILRPATVIGEGDAGNVSRLIDSISKRRFFWIGKGENSKSLIYKNDVARACLAVLQKETKETEVFNLSAEPLKMREIVGIIAENLDKKVSGFYIPEKKLGLFFRVLLKIYKSKKLQNLLNTIEKWLAEDVYSAQKIKKQYDFSPKISGVEALKREAVWFKNKK